MEQIFRSASKLVFLIITLTACLAFLIGKLGSGDFMVLATAAFAFYFSHKGDQSTQFLGK